MGLTGAKSRGEPDVSDTSVSIIIPTIGRDTLARLISEIVPQMEIGDEVLVVGDGNVPSARLIAEGVDPRVRYLEHGPTKDWGHGLRNFAMPLARGRYIMTLDDDDRFRSNGLATIRKAVSEAPNRPLIFRLMHDTGVIWEEKVIRECNVSTQMYVIPNVRERLGIWGNRYQGDLDFITSTLALYPEGSALWREELLVLRGVSHNQEWNDRMSAWKW